MREFFIDLCNFGLAAGALIYCTLIGMYQAF